MATSDQIGFQQSGIANVLETNRLRVPLNQREYSWEEEHVSDFYEDLLTALADNKRTYFLGTIVLTNDDEVSDGQQRLSTTMVMLAAVRDWLLKQGDEARASSVETDFLFKVDRKTTETVPKLSLNVDDNDFFRNRILARPGTDRKMEPTRNSHRLLLAAYHLARQKVESYLSSFAETHRTGLLLDWIDYLQKQALVMVLKVPDHLNAFVLFETLNDRGLNASQADLIKNHVLSLAQARANEAQQLWAKTLGTLETITDDDLAVTFLHHYLITLAGPTKEREVFDRIRRMLTTSASALSFLSTISSAATDYAALFNPEHEKWNDYDDSIRRSISTIMRDLRVAQIRPLMFAVAQKFSSAEAARAFRMFVSWSVRFLIVGGRGGFLDRNYALLAEQVGTGKIKTADALADAARDVVPTDSAFEESFKSAQVSQAHLARYYLRALEKNKKGEAEPEWVPSDDKKAINLEHVLPQNPGAEWPRIKADDAAANYRRIGNLALLQASKNSKIGNKPFDEKKAIFRDSSFAWTAEIAKDSGWGIFEIGKRQVKMAEAAVKTWPVRP